MSLNVHAPWGPLIGEKTYKHFVVDSRTLSLPVQGVRVSHGRDRLSGEGTQTTSGGPTPRVQRGKIVSRPPSLSSTAWGLISIFFDLLRYNQLTTRYLN